MTKPIETVAVCGAGGTMGAGIAIVAARAGFRTICYDVAEAAVSRSLEQTDAFFAKTVERGRMEAADKDAVMSRLVASTSLDDLAAADLVIEAVYEDLETKQALFGKLNTVCPPHTIFASNTSTLSITEIAAGSGRADRVVGTHFCLPAQLMKLIEVSPGLNTSENTLKTAWEWCERAGQLPVKTQDKPGFVLNALLIPFLNDCIRAVEAGVATPADIDTAMKIGLGYKMGPMELMDLVGMDTMMRLAEAFYPVTLDPRCAAPPLLRRMAAAGTLGRKSGRGFFTYDGNAMFGA
jgi:3-hydroxybutyryl-CoA dehydrogenase